MRVYTSDVFVFKVHFAISLLERTDFGAIWQVNFNNFNHSTNSSFFE